MEYESKHLKDEYICYMIRFYHSDGSPVVSKSKNPEYLSSNGNVIISAFTSPTYDECMTQSTLFIPYEELPIKSRGRTDLMYNANILYYTSNTDYEVLDRTDKYSISITSD